MRNPHTPPCVLLFTATRIPGRLRRLAAGSSSTCTPTSPTAKTHPQLMAR
uniref:Uncharacterized protein n=1 Tax=Arundo donax TaxID=35708 RepID=A0A0A9C559_ARUDO